MTPSGTISLQDVNVELGRTSTASINLNDQSVRDLATIGQVGPFPQNISMSSLQSKNAQWVGWTTVVNSTWDENPDSNYTRRHWYRWYIGDMFLNYPYRYIVIPISYYNGNSLPDSYFTGSGTGSTYPMTNFVQLSRSFSSAYVDTHIWGVLAGQVTSSQQYVDFYTSNTGQYNDYSAQWVGYNSLRMNIPEIYIFAGMLPRYYMTSYTSGFATNPSYTRAARSNSNRYKQVVAGVGVHNGQSSTTTGFSSWSPNTFFRSHNYAANHLHIATDQTTAQTYTTSTNGRPTVLVSHYWEFNSV